MKRGHPNPIHVTQASCINQKFQGVDKLVLLKEKQIKLHKKLTKTNKNLKISESISESLLSRYSMTNAAIEITLVQQNE